MNKLTNTNTNTTSKTKTPTQSHYDILEIPRETKSCSTIKKAYRKLALKYHPDKGGDIAKFRKLHEAYERLMRSCINGGGITRRKNK